MANCVCPMTTISTSTRRIVVVGLRGPPRDSVGARGWLTPLPREVRAGRTCLASAADAAMLDKMAGMVGQYFLPKMEGVRISHGGARRHSLASTLWRCPSGGAVSAGGRGNCCSATCS